MRCRTSTGPTSSGGLRQFPEHHQDKTSYYEHFFSNWLWCVYELFVSAGETFLLPEWWSRHVWQCVLFVFFTYPGSTSQWEKQVKKWTLIWWWDSLFILSFLRILSRCAAHSGYRFSFAIFLYFAIRQEVEMTRLVGSDHWSPIQSCPFYVLIKLD